jgi:hypothetical protein
MAINVPMNVQLDAADAGSAEDVAVWLRYLSRWTAWNTLRTILGGRRLGAAPHRVLGTGGFLWAMARPRGSASHGPSGSVWR